MRLVLVVALALAASSAEAASPRRYRAKPADFAALQDGLQLVKKVQPVLFPNGVDGIDAVIYDAEHLYIYSTKSRPYPKHKRWGAYTIYKTRHSGKPTRTQWGGCRGGGGSFVEKALKGKLGLPYFECAPMGQFLEVQRGKKRSTYKTRDGYLATVVHEVAHQYQESRDGSPPGFEELLPRVSSLVPLSSELGTQAAREAYATWCELKASEKRFPKHHAAMLRSVVPGRMERHNLGMIAAREEWLAQRSSTPSAAGGEARP